jgi:Flp pilus assembly protein TadG
MRNRIRFRNEHGQTMTEFALVLPILAVLLFGVIQFGIVFNNYVTLTDAVRAGARKGAVGRFSSNPVGDVQTAIKSSAGGLNQGQLDISVSSSWAPASDVAVTATYPYSISLLGMVVKSGRLSSTTTERVE